jgi:translocation and assembly module TamB
MALIGAVVAFGAYIVVHTAAFNRFVLAKILQYADETTGGRATIGRISIHWMHLDVDFYEVSLDARQRKSDAPLFTADRLSVGLKLVSVVRRKIDLAEVSIDRPVLHLYVDARGNTNLPRPPSSARPTSTSVFDIGIEHIAIDSGVIYYNDKRIPLSVDLHDLTTRIEAAPLSSDYNGSISYKKGRVLTDKLNPIEHQARLQFTANRAGIALTDLNLDSGKSHVEAHGTISNYVSPAVQAKFAAKLDVSEVASFVKYSSMSPSGQVSIDGAIQYEATPDRSVLDSVEVAGNVNSPALGVPLGNSVAQIESIRAEYTLRSGALDITNLDGSVFHGRISADYRMEHLSGDPDSRLEATVRDVSLSDLSAIATRETHGRIRVVGQTNADLHATWVGAMRNLTAQSHISIRGPVSVPPSRNAIPLSGIIDVLYNGSNDTATFRPSRLQTGNTELSVSGTVSGQSDLNLTANTRDLSEVIALEALIRASTSKFPAPLDLPELHGAATLTAQVSGKVSDPIFNGQIAATNVKLAGSDWPVLRAKFALNSSSLSARNGYIEDGRQGRIEFDLRSGLQKWSFTNASPVMLDATVTKLSVADIQHAANLQYPIAGEISGRLSFSGTVLAPAGRGTLQLADGTVWGEPLRATSLNFEGDGSSIHSTARIQFASGVVAADITYLPSQRGYRTTLIASGLNLESVQILQARHLELAGTLSGSASGSGTIDAPQFTGNFEIPALQIRGQTISGVQAHLDVTHEHANLIFNSTVASGYVQAKADVALTGEYPATASVDARALPLQLLFAAYVPADVKFEGQTELHATMSGPLKDPQKAVAHAQIAELSLSYGAMKIANASPLNVDYSNGIVSLKRTEMKGSGTDLVVEGEANIFSAAAGQPTALSASANGTVDIGILQGLGPETRSSGKVEVQISARGALAKPDVQGSIRVENIDFSSPSLPVGFTDVNGRVALAGNRIDIQQLAGKAGGGELSLQGSMIYGSAPVFNLSLHADSVRLRPEQMRAVLNADLQLTGTSEDSAISGRVLVDRLSFVRGFDLSDFVTQFSGPTAVTSPSPIERSMKLNIAVQSSQNISLASNQLSLEGAANLNVVGNLANPVMLGRISLTGGEVFFLGKRYQLQSGSIVFSNPVRTEPNLNLYVTTTVEQYNITLNLIGTLDRLRTNYTSEPALPTIDIVNLIAFGQTTAERQSSSANTTSTTSAESVVAQGIGSQVAGGIAKAAGISQLTIDPLAGGSQNPGAQVAIQQRVTGNLLLTLSTDVTSTQSESVQLQYQLNPRWQVSVLRDQNGGYGMTVRLHKQF